MLHKAALDLSELPASPPEIRFLKSISCCQGMVKQQHRYGIHLLVMLLNNFCINSNNFFLSQMNEKCIFLKKSIFKRDTRYRELLLFTYALTAVNAQALHKSKHCI